VDRPTGPYYPGDVVHATITVAGEKDMKVREVRAGLVLCERYEYRERERDADGDYETNSHWATDEVWVAKEVLVTEGTIPSTFRKTYDFDWPIAADAIPPYSGKISQIRWLAKITVDRKLRGDINQEVELPVIVPPPGLRAQPGEYGEASDPGVAHMRFWLPRLEFVEGDTIEGRLLIEPRQNFGVSGVRLELLREEYVPRDEGNRHTEIEQKLQLAPATDFRAGLPTEYNFALRIPARGCPTYQTLHSRVNWALKTSLDRRLQKDFTVQQEISIHNGPVRG
jgi:hypothetical protein